MSSLFLGHNRSGVNSTSVFVVSPCSARYCTQTLGVSKAYILFTYFFVGWKYIQISGSLILDPAFTLSCPQVFSTYMHGLAVRQWCVKTLAISSMANFFGIYPLNVLQVYHSLQSGLQPQACIAGLWLSLFFSY